MGHPVPARRVVFWALDPGQAAEAKERYDTVNEWGYVDLVVTNTRPRETDAWWDAFAQQLADHGTEVLIIDNLTRLMPPGQSFRNDEHVGPVLARLDKMADHSGLTIVLVHHAGKVGEDGEPRKTPIGSTAIEAWARHLIRVSRPGDSTLIELDAYGNSTPEFTTYCALTPGEIGDGGPFLRKLHVDDGLPEDATGDDATEIARAKLEERLKGMTKAGRRPAQRRKRSRGQATYNSNHEKGLYVIEHCQGMGRNQAAKALAEVFPEVMEGTHRNQLSRGAYGVEQVQGTTTWQKAS
jgi:hypothetical protein